MVYSSREIIPKENMTYQPANTQLLNTEILVLLLVLLVLVRENADIKLILAIVYIMI